MRWYLRFRLSLADVVELLAERHIRVDRSTVHAWVQRFAPRYQEAARPHRHRVGSGWAVDETYSKVAGRHCYLYRLGPVSGDPRLPQRPRVALAWDELTAQLLAA